MQKPLLFLPVFLFISSCNQSSEPKPDADRVIRDTVAQNNNASAIEETAAGNIVVRVEAKDEDVLRKQDAAVLKFLAAIKTEPQQYVIDAAAKSELKGKQGTKISFEPNSFVAESGAEVSSVDISLKECYTLADMLQENLTTMSSGKILESKGMIFVSASCNGEELKLKEGKRMSVEFPFELNEGDGYTFFYGEEKASENINWTVANNTEQPLETFVAADFQERQLQKPEFSLNGLSLEDYLIDRLDYPESAKRNELSANVDINLVIDRKGKATVGLASSVYKTFRDEIDSVVAAMPLWKPASLGDEKFRSVVRLNIDFNIRNKKQIAVSYNPALTTVITNSARWNSDKDFLFSENMFAKSFDKMGWINCDRFLSFPSPKADIIVRADSKSDVKIVFKKLTSIMSGQTCVGYSRFQNIPVNAEVYVVAVRYEEGNILYALKPLTLKKQNVVSLDWKKGTEADVAKMFRSINAAT